MSDLHELYEANKDKMTRLISPREIAYSTMQEETNEEVKNLIDARELPDEVEAEDRLRIYREKSTGALYGLTRAQFEGSVWMQQRYEEANL